MMRRADLRVPKPLRAAIVLACMATMVYSAAASSMVRAAGPQHEWRADAYVVRLTVTVGEGADARPADAGTMVRFVVEGQTNAFAEQIKEPGVIEFQLFPGTWHATVEPTPTFPVYGQTSFTVESGSLRPEEHLTLKETRLVETTVVLLNKSDGKPLVGIGIDLTKPGHTQPWTTAVTDNDGRARLGRLWEHEAYRLHIHDEQIVGEPERVLGPEDIGAGEFTWRVRLRPGGRPAKIRIFLLESGERVPFARERFPVEENGQPSRPVLDMGRPHTYRGELQGGIDGSWRPIDDNGVCAFNSLLPGLYVVSRAIVPMHGDYYPVEGSASFDLPAGDGSETTIDLVFGPEPLLFTLRGTVTDASTGRPIEGALVSVWGTITDAQELTTGADGAFEAHVDPTVCRVRAEKDGYSSGSTNELVLNDTAIEFRLKPVPTTARRDPLNLAAIALAGCIALLVLLRLLLRRRGQA